MHVDGMDLNGGDIDIHMHIHIIIIIIHIIGGKFLILFYLLILFTNFLN